MGTMSISSPGWQLTKWSLGDGGRAGRNPSLLHVCFEDNCWENPMMSKPSPSLLTEKQANIKPHPEIPLTAETNSPLAGLVISRQLLWGAARGGDSDELATPHPLLSRAEPRRQQEKPLGAATSQLNQEVPAAAPHPRRPS